MVKQKPFFQRRKHREGQPEVGCARLEEKYISNRLEKIADFS